MAVSAPRYVVARWRRSLSDPHPMGVVSREYLRVAPSPANEVHRRAFLGGELKYAPIELPAQLVRLLRWRRKARSAANGVPEVKITRFREATGVPPEVQYGRLRQLAECHAIPPFEAMALGVIDDGRFGAWADYVYSHESRWNQAASSPGGRQLLSRVARSEDLGWLYGAAGVEPVPVVSGAAAVCVVTRDVGARTAPGRPALFSAHAEEPMTSPIPGGEVWVPTVGLSHRGEVQGELRPPWLIVAGRPLPASGLSGRLESFSLAVSVALRLHRHLPGVFVVQSRFSLTAAGLVFTGIDRRVATHAPQWNAGGLLAGMTEGTSDAWGRQQRAARRRGSHDYAPEG